MKKLALGFMSLGLARGLHAADPPTDFKALLHEAWEFQLREDPLLASSTGDTRYDDRLPSVAPADFGRRGEVWRKTLLRRHGIDRAGLSEPDRVSYDMFQRNMEDEVAEVAFATWRMPLN